MNASVRVRIRSRWTPEELLTVTLVTAAFVTLSWQATATLLVDWWFSGEYGHGFLLLPIAIFIAWRQRITDATSTEGDRGVRFVGLIALSFALGLFLLGVLAGERFTQRMGLFFALAALVVYYRGWAQLRAWWLPFALLLSTIPLPDIVLTSITLPLQLVASKTAVWLLQARHVPAAQAGNIIFLPGQELFVAAACSGLRSLSALLGLSLLIAGTSISSAWGRWLLLALAIPAAIGANVLRVFLTGFGAYYIGPEVASGLTHHGLAALVFVLPLGVVGLVAVLVRRVER